MGFLRAKTSSHLQVDPLDRAIEASLRRQFQIPAPVPNPGTTVPLTKWEWPSLNVELRMPRLGLRAAAGLLLAATLWGASGVLVLRHVSATSGSPFASTAATKGEAITTRPALVGLGLQFARPAARSLREDEEFAVRQAEMWAKLGESLSTRYGEDVAGRAQELRDSESFELVSVQDGFSANESLLMISARVDGNVSAVLLEQTQDVSRLALPEERRQGETVSSWSNAQLFRGRISGGVGYEITGIDNAVLIPLLFEGAEMQAVMKLRPERYRTLQRPVSATLPMEGTGAR